MRRSLVSALVVPAFLLSACGGDEPSVDEAAPPAETAEETTMEMAPPETAEETQAPADDATATTEAPPEAAAETEAPADEATATTGAGDTAEQTGAAGGPPGGEDGEAAAAVTKDFLVALATADPEVCQLIISVTGEGPMSDSPDQVQICEDELVPSLEGMMSEDEAAIIELIEISGAQVDGDSATVSGENFDELFAAGFGEDEIALRKFEDEWYIDLENSFGG